MCHVSTVREEERGGVVLSALCSLGVLTKTLLKITSHLPKLPLAHPLANDLFPRLD